MLSRWGRLAVVPTREDTWEGSLVWNNAEKGVEPGCERAHGHGQVQVFVEYCTRLNTRLCIVHGLGLYHQMHVTGMIPS